ncbi:MULTISPECIES: hypothetical protein [Arthrobacter]|nr:MULTISPECIES: hypothetical protein [Arthrobacter]
MLDDLYGSGWGVSAWAALALVTLVFWGAVVTVVMLQIRRNRSG